MRLDIPTLAAVTVFVTALLGALLLYAGTQTRAARAPTVWGLSFMLGALGMGLVIGRGAIPDWLSIGAANALVLVAFGLIWAGVRLFDGRRMRLPLVAVAPALWIVACLVPDIGNDINHRTILASALCASLAVATAREVWRGRAEPLLSRWPTVVTLLIYSGAMAARIPATLLVPQAPHMSDYLAGALFPVVAFGTLMFTVILAFLLLNMSKERTELQHKTASLVDPLSGVANRRAFLAGAERLAAMRSGSADTLAVLLFDLDHFKAINDRKGHAAGDDVIRLFAAEAVSTLGAEVLFGRLGGEEFGAMMPVRDSAEAVTAAQRVRLNFAMAAASRSELAMLLPTVSIGVAASRDGALDRVMAAADDALYRAKANGRNRVECAAAPEPAAPSPVENLNARRRWRNAASG